MKSKVLMLETPEKIRFTYVIAELGTRAAAYIIDCLIQGGILLFLLIIGGLNSFSIISNGEDGYLYYAAVFYILMFLFQWGYFLFFETLMNGQTPGKKICQIRVISRNGDRLDFQTLVIRNLLRSADSIPFPLFNILGGIVAILQKENRRLGDLVVGTLVVVDNGFNLKEPDFETAISMTEHRLFGKPLEKDRLTEKDLYILRRLLNDKDSMSKDALERTTATVAQKLKRRYKLKDLDDISDITLIEEIYKAHTYED